VRHQTSDQKIQIFKYFPVHTQIHKEVQQLASASSLFHSDHSSWFIMCGRIKNFISSIVVKYGPAYFISMHVLSIASFWIIYLTLRASEFDLQPYLRDTDLGKWVVSFLNQDALSLLEQGGTFAAAMLLNRLLTPVRIAVVLLTLPRTAPTLNAAWHRFKRWWRPTAVTAAPETEAAAVPTTDQISTESSKLE
jgi:hypothetical protein